MTRPNLILLVEDNRDDEELARLALRESFPDHSLEVARDGEAALDQLLRAARAQAPRLVLLDLNLPKVGGLEVLERVRSEARTRMLPVVVLSSSTEERDLREAYNRGANGYVRKPIDFTEFVEVAQDLCRFWLMRNQPPPAS